MRCYCLTCGRRVRGGMTFDRCYGCRQKVIVRARRRSPYAATDEPAAVTHYETDLPADEIERLIAAHLAVIQARRRRAA